MTSEEIKRLFDNFSRYNIMVIGDVMIDAYIWGKVERISPEAPVPIVRATSKENRVGGAANVALNIQALGAKPILCSVIGDNQNGQLFFELLEKHGLAKQGILLNKDRKTSVKTRVISNHQQLMRVDEEDTEDLDASWEQKLIGKVKEIIQQEEIHAIIFQDYNKGVLTEKIIRETIAYANGKHIPSLVDPKKQNFMNFKGVDLFKPNFKELSEGMNRKIDKKNKEAVLLAAKELQSAIAAKTILLTLSEQGMLILDAGSHHHVPAEVRDIADVSGAGDTVISTASLCLVAGLPPRALAILSNLAGGLVCEKIGVVPVDKEKLQKEAIEKLGKG
jgi:rfaE bifunctional protein kinase chain/domain